MCFLQSRTIVVHQKCRIFPALPVCLKKNDSLEIFPWAVMAAVTFLLLLKNSSGEASSKKASGSDGHKNLRFPMKDSEMCQPSRSSSLGDCSR